MSSLRPIALILIILVCAGCMIAPPAGNGAGPEVRPPSLDRYYRANGSYTDFSEETLRGNRKYDLSRITVQTAEGEITIDYFRCKEPSDDLIFVFPILGGSNRFSNYFANYYARRGLDAAIIHRNNDFKDPEKFYEIEEVLRAGVIRDRIAIDLFENEFGKKDFGTFGISRGALNAAVTAGVDPRLKYNVLAMGGADIPRIFKESRESGIRRYRREVRELYGIDDEELFRRLEETIETDPKNVARYIDPSRTLIFLAAFDRHVPIRRGRELKALLGHPRTVYFFTGHYTSIVYLQYLPLILPFRPLCVFPIDYAETESLAFFRKSFGRGGSSLKLFVFRVLQSPFSLSGYVLRWLA